LQTIDRLGLKYSRKPHKLIFNKVANLLNLFAYLQRPYLSFGKKNNFSALFRGENRKFKKNLSKQGELIDRQKHYNNFWLFLVLFGQFCMQQSNILGRKDKELLSPNSQLGPRPRGKSEV
jgi:hypothetical protein